MIDEMTLQSNSDLRYNSRQTLTGNWWPCVGLTVVYVLISFVLGLIPFVGGIASLIISGPIQLGLTIFYVSFIRAGAPDFNKFFEGFQDFGRALAAFLLVSLFTIGWTLLLVIPGIIAAYRYSQTFYVLMDDPDISAIDAIRKSSDMMSGAKMKLFMLHLSFIGWALLTIVTFGIGQLFLIPYVFVAQAFFYEDLKGAYTDAEKSLNLSDFE
tara:strand:+ start:212 stop:847 length:636 start_codon:yes stop_codon:yes gene_type:complete